MINANNYIEEFRKDLNPSELGLEYYDKRISNLGDEIAKLKYETRNAPKDKIERYESERNELIKKRKEAKKALEKIRNKSKGFIKESKLSLDYATFMELNTFLKEYEKESKVFSKENHKASKKLEKERAALEKELNKNGSKVLVASSPIRSISLKNYQEINGGLDEIVKKIVTSNEKEDVKKEEQENTESNKIKALLENGNFDSKEKDILEISKDRYDSIAIHIEKAKKAQRLIEKLLENENYKDTVNALYAIRDSEYSKVEGLQQEIKEVLGDINIDDLYDKYKEIKELNKKIEVENLEEERIKNSDNKFTQEYAPFQEELQEDFINKRNMIMEENDELDTLGINEKENQNNKTR